MPRTACTFPSVLRPELLKTTDRPEAAVRLNHSQKHLIRTAVARVAIGEFETAKVKSAGFLHGLDQGFPGRFAIDLFERGDDCSPDKIALERDEARLNVRGGRFNRILL